MTLLKRSADIFGEELYVVLLADGRDVVSLFLKSIHLIFRQSSITEYHLHLLICIGPFISFCRDKNIQLICLIFVKVLLKIKINSIFTLSMLLTCVLFYFGRSTSSWAFFLRFIFKLPFFKDFRHGNGLSVKAIMLLSAKLPLAIGLKCFWFLIALLLYPKSTMLGLSFLDPKHLYLRKQFSRGSWQKRSDSI